MNKEIPPEELERIKEAASNEYPSWTTQVYDHRGYSGYCNGATAEYLRHLSLSSKPGIGPNGFPGDTVLAIQWDGTAYTWWILNKAEMPFENGPMGGRTFFLKINDDEKIQISPGDWVVKDKAGKFHRCESIPSSEPAKESQPEEGTYARSELFEICGEWSGHLLTISAHVSILDLSDIFNDWFDKNYPPSPQPEPSEAAVELLEARKIIEHVKETGRMDGSFRVYRDAIAFLDKYPSPSRTPRKAEEQPLIAGKDFICEDQGEPECTKQCWSCEQSQEMGEVKSPFLSSPPSVKAFDMDDTASLNSISKEMFAPSVKLDGLAFAKWLDRQRDECAPLWKDRNIWGKEGALQTLYAVFLEAPHLPDTNVGDIPQQSESQPSVKPEREDEGDKRLNGYFTVMEGKLDFICETKGVSFHEVKNGLLKLRAEIDRQLNNEKNCPLYQPSPAPPAVQQEDGEVPQFTSIWDASEAFKKAAEEYYGKMPISPNALLEKNHNVVRRAAAEWGATWMRKALEQELKDQKAKQRELQSQLSAKEQEIESLIESVESWEGEARRLAAGKEDYIKHLGEMKSEAIQNVNLFKDPDTDDEISELRYWYGKQCAYEEAISKYTPQNPPKNE